MKKRAFFSSLSGGERPSAQIVDKGFCFICLQVKHSMLASTGDFAPAGATRGLSDRPLDSFGSHTCETSAS